MFAPLGAEAWPILWLKAIRDQSERDIWPDLAERANGMRIERHDGDRAAIGTATPVATAASSGPTSLSHIAVLVFDFDEERDVACDQAQDLFEIGNGVVATAELDAR